MALRSLAHTERAYRANVHRVQALEPSRRHQVSLRLAVHRRLTRIGNHVPDVARRAAAPGQWSVTVFGKGSKTRTVLLPNAIRRELLRFRQRADRVGPAFASRRGG